MIYVLLCYVMQGAAREGQGGPERGRGEQSLHALHK